MLLFILILAGLSLAVWLLRRDLGFIKKDLKEVASEDLKAYLNLPSDKARFGDDLQAKTRRSRPSREILKEMNKDRL